MNEPWADWKTHDFTIWACLFICETASHTLGVALPAPIDRSSLLNLIPPPHTHPSFQVVHEVYDEIVFWEPTEAFYALWNARVVGPAPHSQLEQFFLQFDPDYEYRRLQHARQRVAAITANVKGQIAALESAA